MASGAMCITMFALMIALVVCDCSSIANGQPLINKSTVENPTQIPKLAGPFPKATIDDPISELLDQIYQLKLALIPQDIDPETRPRGLSAKREIRLDASDGLLDGAPKPAAPSTDKSFLDRPTLCHGSIGAATSGYQLLCRKRLVAQIEPIEQDHLPSFVRGLEGSSAATTVDYESSEIELFDNSELDLLKRLLDRLGNRRL